MYISIDGPTNILGKLEKVFDNVQYMFLIHNRVN